MNRRARWSFVLASVLTAGCAGTLSPAFDDRFADSTPARLAEIGRALPTSAEPARTLPILCATSDGPAPKLIAFDLERKRVLWQSGVHAETRPELLGDLVVTTAGGRVLGFDAASGRERLNVAEGACSYRGAARSGERLFFSCGLPAAHPGAVNRGRITAVDLRSSRVVWQREADGELGRPAAIGSVVFVPWQWQNLALLDAGSGRELARVRSRDDVIEWVRADARGVFFGQRTLYRFGRLGYGGAREAASYVSVDSTALPGRPASQPSAFLPEPATRGAYGRIALYLEPEARGSDGVAIAHDRYYFTFYRYVFAFDPSGELRWARMLEHDALAGEAAASGFSVVTDDGRVRVLSPSDGATLYDAKIGASLTSAALSISGLTTQSPTTGDTSLRRELTEIALDTDNRLVPARAYAVTQLARLEDPDVTRDLLDIYSASSTPPEVDRVVADALRTRKLGLEHLIDALAAHYDFLEQSRPAPLQVIVPPLIEAHDTRAVPRLIERMRDPETPLAVMPLVVRGVVELGDDSVLEPLLGFLRLYRADSSFAEQPDALLEAVRGIVQHAHERAPALLASLNADGRASPALVAELAKETARPESSGDGARSGANSASAAQAAQLPGTLSQNAVREVFAEHIDELRGCVIDELGRNPKLAQLRIAFIAESDGSTHGLHFAPNTPALVDCLYPKVAALRFPRFASGREVESYVIAVRAGEAEPVRALEDTSGEAFWRWYARRPHATLAGAAPPWWQSQQAAFVSLAASDTKPAQVSVEREAQAPESPAPAAQAKPAATESTPNVATQANDAWWTPKRPSASPQPASAPPPATAPTGSTSPNANSAQPAKGGEDAWWRPKTKSSAPPPASP